MSVRVAAGHPPNAMQFDTHEAEGVLSDLLRRAESGEEVVITRDGKPVARLVPVPASGVRRGGGWRGRVRVAPDFDRLTEDELKRFESGDPS